MFHISLDLIRWLKRMLLLRHLATWRMLEIMFNRHGPVFNLSLEADGWRIIKKYVAIVTSSSLPPQSWSINSESLTTMPSLSA